jgi:beta-galactosidase
LKNKLIAVLIIFASSIVSVFSAEGSVGTTSTIEKDAKGYRLIVDGKPFEVKGVVWSYTPVNENFTYDLWSKPDSIIMENIDRDAELMKEIGVNAIRVFNNVPAKWVTYFYRQHGIYTIINPLFGRYGVSARGIWYPNTDYSDLYSRKAIVKEALDAVTEYKDVPGVLMFMFGNENNYGLEWESNIIKDLPIGQQNEARAAYLYSLFEEAISEAKKISTNHVYGLVNGDIQYLNLIEELVPSVDLLGVNTYRGKESGDLFFRSIEELGLPIVYTEFGADAFNAKTNQEDQYHQAYYIYYQWLEIYKQGYGKGASQNALGGFVFQWMDEWWKHGQEKDLDIHDKEGSWKNGGYEHDAYPGLNNMQEEWFGIIGLSERKLNGVHRRVPRAAYYLLGDLWKLSIYDSTAQDVSRHFSNINPALSLAKGESIGIREAMAFNPVRLDGFFVKFTGTTQIDKKGFEEGWQDQAVNSLGQEAGFTVGFEPAENLKGSAEVRVWGNPIVTGYPQDNTYPVYYDYNKSNGSTGINLSLYSAEFEYDNELFLLEGFYRTGRPDWFLHGDPFNLMPEAWDRYNMDIAGSSGPFGIEVQTKGLLDGFRFALGPELYWGAQPSVAANYYKEFYKGNLSSFLGVMYREQIFASTSSEPGIDLGRKASINAGMGLGPFVSGEISILHSGYNKLGDTYYSAQKVATGTGLAGSDYKIYDNEIALIDTFAAKAKVSTDIFRYTNLYASYLYAGKVAEGESMTPRSGFQKGDSGSGNRQELNIGTRIISGDLATEGVFRWRKPLEGPMVKVSSYTLRDKLKDPFSVFWNRETIEGEVVLTYDTEGATYFHNWDNKDRENSKIAGSLSLLYTYYAGPTDAGVFKADATTWYAFPKGLPEANHLWSGVARIVLNPLQGLRLNLGGRMGLEQSVGEDSRLVNFSGIDLDVRYKKVMLDSSVSFNSWGPETWHREFNLTYPTQWDVDLSYGFDIPSFIDNKGRIGFKTSGRAFDQYSANSEPNDGFQTISTVYVELSY